MMRNLIIGAVGALLVAVALAGAVAWFAFRVYVPEDRCAVLIRNTGRALPAGQLVATEKGQKGIQEDVLGPGRYFYNPYSWDYQLKPLTVIPSGDPSTWEWVHSLGTRAPCEPNSVTFLASIFRSLPSATAETWSRQ